MKCRHCNAELNLTLVDLGFAPPSNAYLTKAQQAQPQVTYPLKVLVCEKCWLVQTQDIARADELFDKDYAYFSSTSQSWLKHAEEYCAATIKRFELDHESFVIEIASNDGYLLKNFVNAGISCLGVEPTESTSKAAAKLGIPQCQEFFGRELAQQLLAENDQADLVIANNVLAHVPDINGFCEGISIILKPGGVVSFEFPHLLRLIEQCQFDTIYHEHFSYLSLLAVSRILGEAGLEIFDVEELQTHGGSLRVFASQPGAHTVLERASKILEEEKSFGLNQGAIYLDFQDKIEAIKQNFLRFLLEAKAEGKSVAAYGAAAKGNTLLNFAGIKPDLLSFVVDAAPSKQNKFLPGSNIPIHAPEYLEANRPDILIILPWNLADEIANQNKRLHDAGTRMMRVIPEIEEVQPNSNG